MIRTAITANLSSVNAENQRIQAQVVPVAEVRALNTTNLTMRTNVIRGVQGRLGLKSQKTLRRQIRIPRSFRARRGKPFAGGLYDVIVPAASNAAGVRLTFKYGKADRTLDHTPFSASMKNRHKGLFVHAPKGHPKAKRPWRDAKKGGGRYRTQLPIWEVMVDVTPQVDADVRRELIASREVFRRRFEREFRRLMARNTR